jgi:1-acyl-sn-glycerol-3-phosphate acyltransferase
VSSSFHKPLDRKSFIPKISTPIVPVALQTNAWGNGNWIKDFGKIDPSKQVRFAFGAPLAVTGRGTDQHQAAIDYIGSKLEEWGSA